MLTLVVPSLGTMSVLDFPIPAGSVEPSYLYSDLFNLQAVCKGGQRFPLQMVSGKKMLCFQPKLNPGEWKESDVPNTYMQKMMKRPAAATQKRPAAQKKSAAKQKRYEEEVEVERKEEKPQDRQEHQEAEQEGEEEQEAEEEGEEEEAEIDEEEPIAKRRRGGKTRGCRNRNKRGG